jgi:dihydroorotase
MSLGRVLQRFRVLGCLAVLALSSACQRHEVVAENLVLDREPVTLAFRTPDVSWVVDAARFRSKSRNSPFVGWKLEGGVAATIVGGVVRFERNGDGG